MMSGWTTLLFVLNTFIVMVIALNMLIAIVSDSYEYAQIRASKLFLRTRVELAAELVAIGAARSRAPSVAIDTLGRLLAPMKRVLQLTAEPADREDGEDDGGGGDDDDEWQGRALEMERRTQAAVSDSRVQLEARFGEMDARFNARFGEMHDEMGEMHDEMDARFGAIERRLGEVLGAVQGLAVAPPPGSSSPSSS